MKKYRFAIIACLVIVVVVAAVLAITHSKSQKPAATPEPTVEPSAEPEAAETPEPEKSAYAGTTITVYNWYDYIDPEVLTDFTKETGIEVNYVCFTTNEEMYVQLTKGEGNYDIIVPSDYIIERMVKEGSLAELDFDAMPNTKGILSWMHNPDYDPENKYSVPFMWGTVGILYNSETVEGDVTSWATIFDPSLDREVYMLDSIRDSIGVALKYLGYSMNTQEDAELQAAKELLIKQREDGIVRGYLVDEVKDKMIGGEASYAVMWSGDAMYSIMENENLVYVVPEEGSNVWVDGLCIPASSKNKEAAQVFIDYMCRPDIAYRNMEYIYYCTPIQEVYSMMDEEELAYPGLNPSQEIVDRCEFFHDITDRLDIYEQIWLEIRS